jgi:hypothetical protein
VTRPLENEEGCFQVIYHCEDYGFCAPHLWCAAMPTLALFASSETDVDVKYKESLCLMYFHKPPVERCSRHIFYPKWTSLVVFHQDAYPSYFSAWITINRMTLAFGVLIAINLFWCSIFVRLDWIVWLQTPTTIQFLALPQCDLPYGRISTSPTDSVQWKHPSSGR